MSILAIDFGGTRMRAARFSSDLTMLAREETLSHVSDPQQVVIQRLIDLGKQVITSDEKIDAIGIAAPGPLDPASGIIRHAPMLRGWSNVPLAQIISDAFGSVPTFIENDANLGALAEYANGAGQGANPLIYMTLSTGIGGGVVIDGKLFTGWSDLASEPGHQLLSLPDGRLVKLEDMASGTAIGSIARERLSAGNMPSVLRSAAVIDGKAVGEAAVGWDVFALEMIGEAGYWLGVGFVNLLHLFSPEAIVCGGGVARLGDLLFEPARKVIEHYLLDVDFLPDNLIRAAALGEEVCLVGAAYYAAQRISE